MNMIAGVKKRSFLGLDAAKLVAAVLVVVTHSQVLQSAPAVVSRLTGVFISLAVPYFFIVSGFLNFHLAHGDHDEQLRRTWKAAGIGLWLYVAWTVIYLPASITSFVLEGAGFNLKTIIRYAHKIIFVGEWQLWFLLSMAIGYAVIHVMLRAGASMKVVVAVGLFSYVVSCIIEVFQRIPAKDLPAGVARAVNLYSLVFASPRVLFQGIAYIVIGMVLARGYARIQELLRRPALFGCILAVCIITLTVLNYQTMVSADALISAGLYGVLRFILAIMVALATLSWSGYDRNGIFRHMRTLSAATYLAHMYFLLVFTFAATGGTSIELTSNVNHDLAFLIALIGCVLTSVLASFAGRRHAFVAKLFHC